MVTGLKLMDSTQHCVTTCREELIMVVMANKKGSDLPLWVVDSGVMSVGWPSLKESGGD